MENLILAATVENGIEVVNIWDYPDAEFMHTADFMGALSSLESGEMIFTHVLPQNTDGIYEQIDAEYGIR